MEGSTPARLISRSLPETGARPVAGPHDALRHGGRHVPRYFGPPHDRETDAATPGRYAGLSAMIMAGIGEAASRIRPLRPRRRTTFIGFKARARGGPRPLQWPWRERLLHRARPAGGRDRAPPRLHRPVGGQQNSGTYGRLATWTAVSASALSSSITGSLDTAKMSTRPGAVVVKEPRGQPEGLPSPPAAPLRPSPSPTTAAGDPRIHQEARRVRPLLQDDRAAESPPHQAEQQPPPVRPILPETSTGLGDLDSLQVTPLAWRNPARMNGTSVGPPRASSRTSRLRCTPCGRGQAGPV